MTFHELRNGQGTYDRRLDCIRRVDLRTLASSVANHLPNSAYNFRSYTWTRPTMRLDQGREGACVGFGMANELACRPGIVTGITNEWARALYYDIQRADPWPGGEYPGARPSYAGTDAITAAKVVKDRGYIGEVLWALELEDFVAAISRGPACMATEWYEGMFDTDAEGYIRPTGNVMGRHFVCIYGVRIYRDSAGALDYMRSYLKGINSWGADWGIAEKPGELGGCFKLSLIDLAKLWAGGDFYVPSKRRSLSV